jgi:hypothetical protein
MPTTDDLFTLRARLGPTCVTPKPHVQSWTTHQASLGGSATGPSPSMPSGAGEPVGLAYYSARSAMTTGLASSSAVSTFVG